MTVYTAGVKNPVDTGNSYFNELNKSSISGKQAIKDKLKMRGRIKPSDITLFARCEFARWIVDCPNCHAAEFYYEDNLFECSTCGLTARVEIPEQRKAIENILSERPIVNRHWNPKETIQDLQRENNAHRLGVT